MAATRWSRPPDDELIWQTVGEANFIFHTASGETHFVNQLGAWLLDSVATRPQSEPELCDGLIAAFAGDTSEELVNAVHSTLQVLAGLGLIESTT